MPLKNRSRNLQVNEFLKQKDSEQKRRVSANKREFVLKMLPVVESLRAVPKQFQDPDDRATSMHENLGQIQINQIIQAFDKFGYREFSAQVRDMIDPVRHQVPSAHFLLFFRTLLVYVLTNFQSFNPILATR